MLSFAAANSTALPPGPGDALAAVAMSAGIKPATGRTLPGSGFSGVLSGFVDLGLNVMADPSSPSPVAGTPPAQADVTLLPPALADSPCRTIHSEIPGSLTNDLGLVLAMAAGAKSASAKTCGTREGTRSPPTEPSQREIAGRLAPNPGDEEPVHLLPKLQLGGQSASTPNNSPEGQIPVGPTPPPTESGREVAARPTRPHPAPNKTELSEEKSPEFSGRKIPPPAATAGSARPLAPLNQEPSPLVEGVHAAPPLGSVPEITNVDSIQGDGVSSVSINRLNKPAVAVLPRPTTGGKAATPQPGLLPGGQAPTAIKPGPQPAPLAIIPTDGGPAICPTPFTPAHRTAAALAEKLLIPGAGEIPPGRLNSPMVVDAPTETEPNRVNSPLVVPDSAEAEAKPSPDQDHRPPPASREAADSSSRPLAHDETRDIPATISPSTVSLVFGSTGAMPGMVLGSPVKGERATPKSEPSAPVGQGDSPRQAGAAHIAVKEVVPLPGGQKPSGSENNNKEDLSVYKELTNTRQIHGIEYADGGPAMQNNQPISRSAASAAGEHLPAAAATLVERVARTADLVASQPAE